MCTCIIKFCVVQESLDSDAILMLVHESCPPGYFKMNKKCVCEENDVIELCDPQNRGIILTVSV